mgnify:CR=1 FL=1
MRLKQASHLRHKCETNSFKFGMLGSTDSHIDLTIATESNFCGKMAMDRPNPHRASRSAIYSAAGYAAVWASENTGGDFCSLSTLVGQCHDGPAH